MTAIATVFATIAAIAGIALALYGARAERNHRRLLLTPKLELRTHYRYKDRMLGKELVELSLINTGLGPARITEFVLQLNGKRYGSFQEWIGSIQLLPPGHPFHDDRAGFGLFELTAFQQGKIILPQEAFRLLHYDRRLSDPADIPNQYVEQVLCGYFYHLKITTLRFAYQSLLDSRPECKVISGSDWNIPLEIALTRIPSRPSGLENS